MSENVVRRRGRIAEDLQDLGVSLTDETSTMIVEEVDRALHPLAHERMVPTIGTLIAPSTDPSTWNRSTGLQIATIDGRGQPADTARRYADGQSTWLVRTDPGAIQWLLFDRPAGSERDLVILARVLGATIIQREARGVIRVVGTFGVVRWERYAWHYEPPVRAMTEEVLDAKSGHLSSVVEALLTFAVHDLGAARIGSLLVYRTTENPGPDVEERLAAPPHLCITDPLHLAPLRHALAQTDGAVIFDASGTLRLLGVRLIPTREAEAGIKPMGGTRHTSALRYSFDDPDAMVIVVSEAGPVSVLRAGEILATSGLP